NFAAISLLGMALGFPGSRYFNARTAAEVARKIGIFPLKTGPGKKPPEAVCNFWTKAIVDLLTAELRLRAPTTQTAQTPNAKQAQILPQKSAQKPFYGFVGMPSRGPSGICS